MHSPDEVLNKYNRAIHKVASTYYKDNPRFSFVDLVAEAQAAAIKACRGFRPDNERGTTFFTYLTSAMKAEVSKFVADNSFDLRIPPSTQRQEFKREGNLEKLNTFKAVPLISTRENAKSEHFIHSNVLPSGDVSPDIAMIRAESIGILKEEIDNLPDRERVVLNARWMEGKTLEQIAGGFGVTKQTIHGWEKKGFERLRKRVKIRLGEDLVF